MTAWLIAAALLLGQRGASACGASGGGTVGIGACSMAEHEEEIRKRWRVGGAYAFTSTTILFDDGTELEQTRHLSLASVAYRPSRTWTLELGVGPLLTGALESTDARYEYGPGVATNLGASWRALEAFRWRPFLLLNSQLSYGDATTKSVQTGVTTRYRAFDLRVGAAVGWVLWRAVSPYVLARGFGGPVFWSRDGADVVGTDANKFQVGVGLSATVARTIDAFVEGVPLGERGVVVGVGASF